MIIPELFLEQPVGRAGTLAEDTEHTRGPADEKRTEPSPFWALIMLEKGQNASLLYNAIQYDDQEHKLCLGREPDSVST